MIAANFDNLLFLLLVAVAVLFQLLEKAAVKTGKGRTKRTSTPIPRTRTPTRRAPTESDEDRIRKLLEALGQPPTSRPPPPVVPRTEIPPRPVAPVQPPISPLSQLRRDKPRKREATPKEKPAPPAIRRVEENIPPKIIDAPAFEIREAREAYAAGTRPIVKTEEPRAHIVTLL